MPSRLRDHGSLIDIAPVVYLIDRLAPRLASSLARVGRPFGDDFINYWSAAWLAFNGRADEICDWNAFTPSKLESQARQSISITTAIPCSYSFSQRRLRSAARGGADLWAVAGPGDARSFHQCAREVRRDLHGRIVWPRLDASGAPTAFRRRPVQRTV